MSCCNNANLYNCISISSNAFLLRKNQYQVKLTNCYGNFESGHLTSDEDWNYQTNHITKKPQVDSTTYRIIDDENIWKNKGTGEDLDESPADLGVYGGEYSWEYETDLN